MALVQLSYQVFGISGSGSTVLPGIWDSGSGSTVLPGINEIVALGQLSYQVLMGQCLWFNCLTRY